MPTSPSEADCESAGGAAVERTGSLDLIVNNAVLAGVALEGAARDDAGGLGRDDGRQPARAVPALPCGGAPDADAAARGRRSRPDHQHHLAARHGRLPGHFAYSVGKGGLVQMTRQIAVDYGRDGILCNAVAPGKIVTGTPGDLSADEPRAGLRAVAHAVPAAGPGRGRRSRGGIPGRRRPATSAAST